MHFFADLLHKITLSNVGAIRNHPYAMYHLAGD